MREGLKVWSAISLLVLATLACNAFAGRPSNALPPPPTVTPTIDGQTGVTPETPVIAPTATLPGEPTLEPAQGTVRVLVDLNVRSGPGVGFERVGFMLSGDSAPVLGRDGPSGWWKIVCPPRADGDDCWVSGGAQFTRLEP